MKTSKYLIFLLALLGSVSFFSCEREDGADEMPSEEADQTRRTGLIARYAVSGNDITVINTGPAANGFFGQTRQNEFWNFFTNLIPIDARRVMTELELFADPEDGTAAYVAPLNNNDLSIWQMGHNLDFVWNRNNQFVRDETAYTAIHEVAHLLTLDNTQVNASAGNSCHNFHTGEGCSNNNSYINQFFNAFWGDIYAENRRIDPNDFDGYFAFYEKYRNRFVSEYAATNPGEDIAESFTHFVMSDMPSGNSIASRKIRFFNDFQELVDLRQRIRANITFDINLNNIGSTRSQRFMSRVGARN